MIAKHYPGFTEDNVDSWAFWQFEENIKIINEINKEEEKQREKQEKEQSKAGGKYGNPSSYMKSMSSMGRNFGKPKM